MKKIRNDKERGLVEEMHLVKQIFDKHDITFWLDLGALLGTVREGGLIKWDTDIDLGAFENPREKPMKTACEELVENHGFKVLYKGDRTVLFYKNASIAVYTFRRWGRFYKSVWTRYNSPVSHPIEYAYKKLTLSGVKHILPKCVRSPLGNVIWYMYKNMFSKKYYIYVPLRYCEDLEWIDFYGMDVRRPSHIEDYLEFIYGKDWRTPNKTHMGYDGTVLHTKKEGK